jgi:hypothetical protein
MSKALEWVEPIKMPEFPVNLPDEDGEPLESNWHRIQINLLVDLTEIFDIIQNSHRSLAMTGFKIVDRLLQFLQIQCSCGLIFEI